LSNGGKVGCYLGLYPRLGARAFTHLGFDHRTQLNVGISVKRIKFQKEFLELGRADLLSLRKSLKYAGINLMRCSGVSLLPKPVTYLHL